MAGVENPEDSNLWEDMLKESTREGKAVPSHLIVVGSPSCGKTALVDKLRQLSSTPDESVTPSGEPVPTSEYVRATLRYTYFNKALPGEDADAASCVDTWMLSNLEHKSLLSLALQSANLHHTVLMIVLDLSQPWNVARELEEWAEAIQEATQAAVGGANMADADALKDRVRRTVTTYGLTSAQVAEGMEMPLGDGVLEVNLGLPLVIVCNKADYIKGDHPAASTAAAMHLRLMTDSKWDLLQGFVRKFAMRYGAAVCFTSSGESTNTGLLLSYLLHRSDPEAFRDVPAAQVVDQDAVFVPAGFDSADLVHDLLDAASRESMDRAAVEAALPTPKTTERREEDASVTEVLPEEDEWLAGLASRQDAKDATGPTEKSWLDSVIDDVEEASSPAREPAGAASGEAAMKSSPTVPRRAAGEPAVEKDPQEIADFFKSLLTARGSSGRSSKRKPGAKKTEP